MNTQDQWIKADCTFGYVYIYLIQYIYIYIYIYILNLYKGKLEFKENAENTFRSDVLIATNKLQDTNITYIPLHQQ